MRACCPAQKAGAVPQIYRTDRVGVVKIAAVCKLIIVVLPSALDCLHRARRKHRFLGLLQGLYCRQTTRDSCINRSLTAKAKKARD